MLGSKVCVKIFKAPINRTFIFFIERLLIKPSLRCKVVSACPAPHLRINDIDYSNDIVISNAFHDCHSMNLYYEFIILYTLKYNKFPIDF